MCEAAWFTFVPMILEAHSGGWRGAARGPLGWIAQRAVTTSNEEPDITALRLAQRISSALHRENSRAILRRRSDAGSAPQSSVWEGEASEQRFF